MHESGKLILLAGFSGAGKTTMAASALKQIPRLEYLMTYTTRPPRSDKEVKVSIEYIFVSRERYAQLRLKKAWNHGEYDNEYYGADVEYIRGKLSDGINIICCIAPDIPTIKRHSEMYGVKPVIVWLNTSLDVANNRIIGYGDPRRTRRTQDPHQNMTYAQEVINRSDYILEPTGTFAENQEKFVSLAKSIIDSRSL
jgi:guanylate kinase